MSQENLDNRYMEFRIGDQLYALPLLSVKEVIQKPDVTPVPNVPSYFEGMINLRGQILGVVNVRRRINTKHKENTDAKTEVVVVVEQDNVSIGMIVDEVTRVIHTTSEMIKPAPLKEDDPSRMYISFIIQSNDDLILSVNLSELMELKKYKATQLAAA